MKTIQFVFFLTFIFYLTSCDSDHKAIPLNDLDVKSINQLNNYFLNGEVFTGKVVSNQQNEGVIVNFYVDNGQLNGPYTKINQAKQIITQAKYKNGLLDGEHLDFYENNKLRERKIYDNGFLDGKREFFWPNGMLKEQNEFKMGKLIHNSTFYFTNGKLRKKIYFNERGKKDSLWLEYYSNGKVKDCTFYQNGIILKSNQYNKNGVKIN